MTLELEHALRNHAFLRGLPEAQFASLALLANEVSFEEDEIVLVDGQVSANFYLLVEGSVVVELRAPRYVVCVQALRPGDAFGWSALLDHHDTLFQVRARERTTTLQFPGAALQALFLEEPELAREVLHRTLQVVAQRVKATEIRFAEMCGVRS